MRAANALLGEQDREGADPPGTLLVGTRAGPTGRRTRRTTPSARRARLGPALRRAGRRLFTDRSGVTIVEVLVASAILGIGLVGVGSMVTYGVISHQKSQNHTVAAARAGAELERIREATYAGAVVGSSLFPSSAGYTILNSTQVTFLVSDLASGVGLITLGDDTEATATKPGTGLPYSNLKRATVAIGWGGNRYLRGAYTATTLVANRPT